MPGTYNKSKNWKHTHIQEEHNHTQEGHTHAAHTGSAIIHGSYWNSGQDTTGVLSITQASGGRGSQGNFSDIAKLNLNATHSSITVKNIKNVAVNQDAGNDAYSAPPSISGVAYLSY